MKRFLRLSTVYKSFMILAVMAGFFNSVSCSTAPKRAMKVYDSYDIVSQLYQTANNLIIMGKYSDAAISLHQAYSQAVSIDSASLICKVCLSMISLKLAVPKDFKMPAMATGLPILNVDLSKLYSLAMDSADRSDEKDFLKAICSIFQAQIIISTKNVQNYESASNLLKESEAVVMQDSFYAGILERTKGDIFVLEKKYEDAIRSYRMAIDIHTKNRYLYEIGQDWYYLARAFSLNGEKKLAEEAILTALKYDKDAENTNAIGTDYYSYAQILMKDPYTKEELEQAVKAANWSSLVYAAGNFNSDSEKSQALVQRIRDKITVGF